MRSFRGRGWMRAVIVVAVVLLVAPTAVAHGPALLEDEHGPVDQQLTKNIIPELGFFVHPWAAIGGPTSIEWGPDGRLYATTIDGSIVSFRERDPERWLGAADPQVVATGFGQLLGIEVTETTIYVADSHRVGGTTYGRVQAIDLGDPSGARQIVVDRLPQGRHNTNDLELNPVDGKLYITNGNQTDNGEGGCGSAPSICEAPLSGALLRVNPSARDLVVTPEGAAPEGLEVVAHRLRNIYDVAFSPRHPSQAFVPMNGSDNPASDDLLYRFDTAQAQDAGAPTSEAGDAEASPSERPKRAKKPKKSKDPVVTAPQVADAGFPLCLYNNHPNELVPTVDPTDPSAPGDDHGSHGANLEPNDNPLYATHGVSCPSDTITTPIATFGGHVSANGLDFADGKNFGCLQGQDPACTYGNDLYVAEWGNLHGAEDGHVAGHKVVRVDFRDDGSIVLDDHGRPMVREFISGGAPIDVAFRPDDGTMFVADMGGFIYKVFWHTPENPGPAEPDDGGHDHEGHGAEHESTTLADSHAIFGTPFEGHRFSWERHYEDESHDGLPKRSYLYYDGPGEGGHGHGSGGCEPTEEEQAYGDALIDQSTEAMSQYNGWEGFALARQHNFWPYPVTESKLVHMTNVSGRGAFDPSDPYRGVWDGVTLNKPPPSPFGEPFGRFGEGFQEGYYYEDEPHLIDPWRAESFVYGMVDDWDGDPSNGEPQPGPVVVNVMFTFPYLTASDGSVVQPPNPTRCLLRWHNHDGEQGIATSFDPDNPDQSAWMSHLYVWGDLDPWKGPTEPAQAHEWFRPWNPVPATCSEAGCVP